MVNFQRVSQLAVVLAVSFGSSGEVLGQFGGGGNSAASNDQSATLTKTRLTKQSYTTTRTGAYHVDRLSNPNLYRNRGYIAAMIRVNSSQLAYFLWIRHNGLEASEDRVFSEEYLDPKLGIVNRLAIHSQEQVETIILARRKEQENSTGLVVRGTSLITADPVYLHLDLTEQQPKLRRISPTWDNAEKQPLTHRELAEQFVTIDELQDKGALILEEIASGSSGEEKFFEQVKREFEEFFE